MSGVISLPVTSFIHPRWPGRWTSSYLGVIGLKVNPSTCLLIHLYILIGSSKQQYVIAQGERPLKNEWTGGRIDFQALCGLSCGRLPMAKIKPTRLVVSGRHCSWNTLGGLKLQNKTISLCHALETFMRELN